MHFGPLSYSACTRLLSSLPEFHFTSLSLVNPVHSNLSPVHVLRSDFDNLLITLHYSSPHHPNANPKPHHSPHLLRLKLTSGDRNFPSRTSGDRRNHSSFAFRFNFGTVPPPPDFTSGVQRLCEEPPVFGKRSIFVVRSTGVNEQWTQCDSCSKWGKLPIDVLIPPKWTCVENLWDQSRCSCAAPNELNPRELDNLLRLNKEFKKQRLAASQRPALEHESSGLDALANAAILGDDARDSGRTPVVTTIKHPWHRPGCSCIVCIQPPSGKGKHKSTCTCNVCLTVKRRFKTLMMRKKKRQSEHEAEIAQRNQLSLQIKEESEVDSTSRHLTPVDGLENEVRVQNELDSRSQDHAVAEAAKGQLDMNCQPDREDVQAGPNSLSMTSLLEEANLPLETYLKQNGLTSLISEQQTNSASNVQAQTTNDSEGRHNEDCRSALVIHEQETSPEENSG